MYKAGIALFIWLIGSFSNPVLAANPVHSVAFEQLGVKIFLKAYILDSQKINILFDPGTYAYMHTGTVKKHSIDYTSSGQMASQRGSKEVQVFENFPVLFAGYTDTFAKINSQPTAPYQNKRIDLVFGKEWIDEYVVEIDYDHKKIHLWDPTSYSPKDKYAEIKVHSWVYYPVVKATFGLEGGDSLELLTAINLGAETGFVLDDKIVKSRKLLKSHPNKGNISVFGSDGKGIKGMYTKIPSLRIATFRQRLVKGGMFSDSYGLNKRNQVAAEIGQGFMKYYNVVLDKHREVLYFSLRS